MFAVLVGLNSWVELLKHFRNVFVALKARFRHLKEETVNVALQLCEMMLNYFFFFFLGLLNLFLGFHLMFYNFKMAHTFFDFVFDQFGEDGVYCQLVFHLVGYALSCVLVNVEVEPGCRSLQLHVWSNSSAWVLDRDIYCMR